VIAKTDHSKKLHKAKTEAKLGILPNEEARLFAAIDGYHLGKCPSTTKDTNALRGICSVLPYVGLSSSESTVCRKQEPE